MVTSEQEKRGKTRKGQAGGVEHDGGHKQGKEEQGGEGDKQDKQGGAGGGW